MIEAPRLVEERAWIEAVDVGVDHEERIDVPKPDEELRHALTDRPLAVADRRPRRLAGEKIPTQRIGAVGVEDHPRLFVVALALAHLLPVLAEHQPEDDAGAERVGIVGCRGGDTFGKRARPVTAEEERADRQLAVEPAARLVDRLGDEVGGELRGEILVPRVRPAPLGKRHRSRVKPAVNHLRHAPHPRLRREGGVVSDRVDVGLVDAEIVAEIGIGGLGPVEDIGAGDSRLGEDSFEGRDRLGPAGRFTHPDRQRRSPVPFPGEGPVDVRFEEVAEAPLLDVLREPVDAGVVGEHRVAELAGANEPTRTRVLDEGIVVGPPAEGIIVNVLFLVDQ